MSRRSELECLKNIPKEVLTDSILSPEELTEQVNEIESLSNSEMKTEILDLRDEKRKLILAVEHLKERLTK